MLNSCIITPGTSCPQDNFANTRLTGVNLSGASLGVDRPNPFAGNWQGTNLRGADLTGANLGWDYAVAVYMPDGQWVCGSRTRNDVCGI